MNTVRNCESIGNKKRTRATSSLWASGWRAASLAFGTDCCGLASGIPPCRILLRQFSISSSFSLQSARPTLQSDRHTTSSGRQSSARLRHFAQAGRGRSLRRRVIHGLASPSVANLNDRFTSTPAVGSAQTPVSSPLGERVQSTHLSCRWRSESALIRRRR